MTTNLVPQDIYLKHENEWHALREAFETRIDLTKRETPAYNEAKAQRNNSSSAQTG